MKNIEEVMENCDWDVFDEFIESSFYQRITLRVLNNNSEAYLQRVFEGDFSYKVFARYEKCILKICKKIFFENQNSQIKGFFTLPSESIEDSKYARKTMKRRKRQKLQKMKEQVLTIQSIDLYNNLIKIGCREIGQTFIYFYESKTCLIIDALTCIIYCENVERVKEYFSNVSVEHTVY